MHFHGSGILWKQPEDFIQQDTERAFELLKKSADQGDSEGQFNLAVCYATGKGVMQDIRQEAGNSLFLLSIASSGLRYLLLILTSAPVFLRWSAFINLQRLKATQMHSVI